jgi:hypothetical protein
MEYQRIKGTSLLFYTQSGPLANVPLFISELSEFISESLDGSVTRVLGLSSGGLELDLSLIEVRYF